MDCMAGRSWTMRQSNSCSNTCPEIYSGQAVEQLIEELAQKMKNTAVDERRTALQGS